MEQYVNKRFVARTKFLWLVSGITSSVFGAFLTIVGALNKNYLLSTISLFLLLGGMILASLAFSEAYEEI